MSETQIKESIKNLVDCVDIREKYLKIKKEIVEFYKLNPSFDDINPVFVDKDYDLYFYNGDTILSSSLDGKYCKLERKSGKKITHQIRNISSKMNLQQEYERIMSLILEHEKKYLISEIHSSKKHKLFRDKLLKNISLSIDFKKTHIMKKIEEYKKDCVYFNLQVESLNSEFSNLRTDV